MDLHRLEIALLPALKDGREYGIGELCKKTGLDEASVSKAAFMLQEKGLAKVGEETEEFAELTDEGKKVAQHGLAERVILEKLTKGGAKAGELGLPPAVINFALGWLKRKNWATFEKKGSEIQLKITEEGKKALKQKGKDELAIERMANGPVPIEEVADVIETVCSRQLAARTTKTERSVQATAKGLSIAAEGLREKTERLEPQLMRTGAWKTTEFRHYDVNAPAPVSMMAKKHPIQAIIDMASQIFLEMGFTEVKSNMVESSFWNFDALFQPQDHPARDMMDTFFMSKPAESRLPDIADRVKKAHEHGVCGSLGWGYEWKEEIAKQPIMRTHTTVVSARMLSKLKPPAKIFGIDKAFRNEALDYKHLMELYQIDGIVFDENVTFRNLLGYLKEFYRKMGFEKVRFRPAYFPYTEMSVEPEVWYEPKKAWMELGGAGMFRPEVVEPLTGTDIPVLAWGLGFDRLVMLHYGIDDIRTPYKNDLAWLREVKIWQ